MVLTHIIVTLIRPSYQKIIRGEGMPAYEENSDKRGDIVLRFKIEIPRHLSEIKKNDLQDYIGSE